jgi:hypothetical protein
VYQLVVTVREHLDGYSTKAYLAELLPQGGLAPVSHSVTKTVSKADLPTDEPFVRILQALLDFATFQTSEAVVSPNSDPLF